MKKRPNVLYRLIKWALMIALLAWPSWVLVYILASADSLVATAGACFVGFLAFCGAVTTFWMVVVDRSPFL